MDDRQNRLICDECQKSTKEVQKVAEIKSTNLLVYSHKPNTETSKTDRTGNAGDNDAHKMVVAESTNNTKMRAVDIALAMDQYKVNCPRCRYIMHRAQKSLRQISVVEGLLQNNICEHCQAEIKDRPLIKEQFIYFKLQSGGILILRKNAKELLKYTKITKFKHKYLYLSTKRRERRPIITTIDPRIRPLIPSLKLDEESLSAVESPIGISLKETVEVIPQSQHIRDLDKNFLPQSFYYKFPKLAKKSLSEEIIRDRIRSSTELFKDIQARLLKQAEKKKKTSEEIKNYKLQQKEKKRQARIEKMEKLKRSTPITSESETSKLDKNIREKGYDAYESDNLGKSRKDKKSEERIDRKKREKGPQDVEQTKERKSQLFKKGSIRGKEDKHEQEKPDKEKVLPTIKKGIQVLETIEERKSGKDKALVTPGKGLQESGKQKEVKIGKVKDGKPEKEGKSDKEKQLSAPRKGKEEKSDKVKSLPAPGKELPTIEKEKEMKPGKEKVLPARGKGLQTLEKETKPDKEKQLSTSRKGKEEKSNKEKSLPAPGKGLPITEKEKEMKPGNEKALPARGKRLQTLEKEKETKPDKEKLLPAPGKGLQTPEKEKETKPRKEKSDKEKTLPKSQKGTGKKEDKIDKEKAAGKEKEEKSEKDDVLPVTRRPREEKPVDAKDEKTHKEEDLAATRKGLKALEKEKETNPVKGPPGKKEEKSDKEKTSPKSQKGTGKKEDKIDKEKAVGKEKEEKSENDDILPVTRRPREEKPVDAKGGKTHKEEDLAAIGKGLKTPEKEKETKPIETPKEEKLGDAKGGKSYKEKALPAPGQGTFQSPGKKDKSDKEKEMSLATGKEKEEETEEQVLPVPKRPKDEQLDVAKYEKLFKEEPDSEIGLKVLGKEKDVKSDKTKAPPAFAKEAKKDELERPIDNEMDERKGKTRKETSRRKSGEEDEETVKLEKFVDNERLKKKEYERKDLVQINDIKVSRPQDDILINLILKFEKTKKRRKPQSIIIPPFPAIHLKKKFIGSGDWFTTQYENEFMDLESSSSTKDVVYINKIIKKQEIPSTHRSETKKRADIICKNNIFKDDLQQSVGELPPTVVADSQNKLILSKDSAQEGAFRYVLSDRTFIEKGWTMLPIEKVVRKTNVYRMRPAHPEFDWFEHNKVKGVMHYDTGEKLAEFKDNGLGQWFYRNGKLALDYYDAKDINAQQRIVIYSNGELDERGRSRPVTILGMFDYSGNGVIFDHKGKVRLKYNQSEGVLLDQQIGPASHWKWHNLNDPPVLQQVMMDTQMPHKDPRIARLGSKVPKGQDRNKDMVAIEFENAIKEKSQKIHEKFSPFQIKMKALKINENFSIRILDQASIYLLFRDGRTNLKLNLGMLLDSHEIVDTDIADLGEISTGLDRLPAQTESLEVLQRNIKYAQRFERYRTERDRRLRLPVPATRVDRIKNLISKPLKPALTEVKYVTINGQCEHCYSRKPSFCALYYNNRLS